MDPPRRLLRRLDLSERRRPLQQLIGRRRKGNRQPQLLRRRAPHRRRRSRNQPNQPNLTPNRGRPNPKEFYPQPHATQQRQRLPTPKQKARSVPTRRAEQLFDLKRHFFPPGFGIASRKVILS